MNELKKEVREKTAGYISAALGLVAGLAWNDAVKALIEHVFPVAQDTLTIKFLYAAIVTLVVVLISSYLLKASSK